MVSIPTTVNGTKLVCGGGARGACTIQLDGEPVAGCLSGAALGDNTIQQAATASTDDATPRPETGYKVDLITATEREALERLRQADSTKETP